MKQKLITLLLDSLHQDQNRLNISTLEELSNEEWDELIALAIRMRVRLLFYQNLKKRGHEEIIPEEIAKSLKEFFTQHTMHNLRKYAELHRIVNAFAEKNIPVIALKGIYLADAVYENVGLREMNDIDLLVPKADLAEAANTMLTLEYKTLKPFSLDWEPANNHLPPFIKPKAASIEIHWTVTTKEFSPKFQIQDLWDHAQPANIANTDMLSLSPNDILLYLCFHNAKHAFAFTLRPYCDIQATIQHFSSELNWEQILERAKQWGWERNAYLSLRLAREFVGAEIPEYVLNTLKPDGDVEKIYTMAKAQTFADKILIQEINDNIAHYKQASNWERISILIQRFFPSKLEMANKYHISPNSPALFLKYPSRWKDLLTKHFSMMTDIQRGNTELTELVKRKGDILHWLTES